MEFQYCNPIKFMFGEKVFEQIGEICKGHKVMLVYGGSSIKSNGVCDQITKILKEHEIPYVDYGNHTGAANYQVLLDSLHGMFADLHDERARSNIMWASCVNTMGIFRSGVDHSYPWTVFSVCYIPRVAHHVSYREALIAAYPVWLKRISKYHMQDIRTLFIEVFGIDSAINDEAVVDAGCSSIRKLMKKSGIPLTLSVYGACPSKEFVRNHLPKEDFGEFSLDEMYDMIVECY